MNDMIDCNTNTILMQLKNNIAREVASDILNDLFSLELALNPTQSGIRIEKIKLFMLKYNVEEPNLWRNTENRNDIEALAKEICNGCKSRHKCDNECCTMSYVVSEWLIENGYGKIITAIKEVCDHAWSIECRCCLECQTDECYSKDADEMINCMCNYFLSKFKNKGDKQ